jgi:hypothetical protein
MFELFGRYVCPRCEPDSKVNFVNFKQLNPQDFDSLKKLFKQIQVAVLNEIFRISIRPLIKSIGVVDVGGAVVQW